MGFDIDMVKTPKAALPGLFEDSPGYIRLTSASMAGMVEVMRAAGVLDDAAPLPPFPDWPPPSLDEDRAAELRDFFLGEDEADPPPTAAERRAMTAYLRGRGVVEAARSELPGRVPAFKFASNDNWLVCPEECRAIADGLDRWLAGPGARRKGIDRDGVRLWAAHNRSAAEHGGYRVN